MTGSDIAFWLAGIWDDLLNLNSADIPLLALKLFMLFIVLFFGWQFSQMIGKALWRVSEPTFRFVWRIITAPVRLPVNAVKRLSGQIAGRRRERQWQRERLAAAERAEAMRREQEQRRAEARAEMRRLLDAD
jgi:hypothetical protein